MADQQVPSELVPENIDTLCELMDELEKMIRSSNENEENSLETHVPNNESHRTKVNGDDGCAPDEEIQDINGMLNFMVCSSTVDNIGNDTRSENTSMHQSQNNDSDQFKQPMLHICPMCYIPFPSKAALRRHTSLHSRFPLRCQLCHFNSIHADFLARHKVFYHNIKRHFCTNVPSF